MGTTGVRNRTLPPRSVWLPFALVRIVRYREQALRSLSVVSVRVVKLAVLPSVCNLHELSVEQRLCQINQVPLEFTSTHSELGQ